MRSAFSTQSPMARVCELKACEIHEESVNVESRNKAKHARVLIRVFAVIRLLITIFVSAYILEYGIFQPSRSKQGNMEESNIKEIKRIEILVKDQIQEIRALSQFHRKLAEDTVNIMITAFLWAGAFANNHVYLPIYVILEVAFSSFVFLSYVWALSHSQPGIAYGIAVSLAFFFVAYCAFFVPVVVYRYCKYLERKDQERRIDIVPEILSEYIYA